ncbi:MAG TPA: DUF4249 domain-containing protein, partial [Pricia sp.]|nr:DUF4249 domain-containing protein [Pricia sp.]
MIETRRSAPLFVSTFLLPVRCPQTTKENYGYVHWFVFITLSFLLSGCLEEFEPETNSFESILVVEAVITDEVKPQEILLNQTFRFEEQGPRPEQNAIVQIVEDGATNYTFTEVEPGRYVSNENFGATSGIDYELVINTMDGTTYRSDAASLSGANASLDDLDIVKTMNRDKVDGVSLRVNSFNASDNSGYYRLEYEETYNIIAPRWTLSDAVYVNGGLVFQQRTEEQRTCYATKVSNSSILVNTNVLEENSISGFQVRFIARDDFIIAHRY